MTVRNVFRQVLQSGLVALFLAWPVAGWSTTVVVDRPLFIDAPVEHNVIFAIDDSGSMDWELLVPQQSGMTGSWNQGYLFDPGYQSGYKSGKRLYHDRPIYSMQRNTYFFYSPSYNLQYYDPSAEYIPWTSAGSRNFSDQSITNAKLDPGFGNSSETADLTAKDELEVGTDNIPATVFLKTDLGVVEKVTPEHTEYADCPSGWRVHRWDRSLCIKGRWQTKKRGIVTVPETVEETLSCKTLAENWYSSWTSDHAKYRYRDENGNLFENRQWGLARDGACLLRLELVAGNEALVQKLTGDSLASQQTNFANWFSYYRRRHQAIRAAVSQSVEGLEDLRLGATGLNDRYYMSSRMYSANTAGGIGSFLNDQYALFDDGSYIGRGTPTRKALQHVGKEYAKSAVRGGNLECRKNFALLFTDGFANGHPGSTDAGNADQNASAPFGDSNSDTLADIAYYYYQGLRTNGSIIPDGAVRTPPECGTGAETAQMDCNTEHHMNTYTVALGMKGEKYAGISHFNVADAHKSPPDWSSLTLSGSGDEQIDDLYHAAVNGKGEYYDAQSTTALVSSLKKAMRDVQQQLGNGSNVSFNTTSLKSGGYIFSAQFTSQIWTGTLRAEAIDKDGVVSSLKWDAATKLDARDLTASPRLILTNNGSGGVEFDWANLTAAQKDDLKAGGSEALGKARWSFIVGNDVKKAEGVEFRERKSRLGAIVNSSPVYVGEPNRIWPDQSMFGGSPYSTFKVDKASRAKAVYVGANDGMLHGFNAETGEEILGYVPSFLYSSDADKGLSALTNPNLDFQSYVDLPLNTSDVYVNGAWRSIVIGGSRGATPGIFALDVTDPSQFSAANAGNTVMWEFSGNSDLGNMTDAVQIALINWGADDYRWSAVFSNGYNAPSGKNGLFVVDIGDPANYEFIEVASGDGLSPARLADYQDSLSNDESDGVADRAYAGDLEGRLWAIDLTGGRSNWGVLYGGDPLFVAKDSLGNAQPISAQPDVARNTVKKDLGSPNLLVFFGTGRYLEASDIPAAGATPPSQSFYGINDRGSAADSSGNRLRRDDLTERTVSTGTVTVDGEARPVRKTDGGQLDWNTSFGWYVDLPTSGERVAVSPAVRGDFVVFSSTIPTSGDPCGGGGSSFLTALAFDGATSVKPVIDVNNDGILDANDEGWAGMYHGDGIITGLSFIDNLLYAPDSNANKTPILTDLRSSNASTRRLGWHELLD
ncbi:pilus assembly protein [Marinobacter sp. CA1]|uniref:pilus assembly protein n=1 Tax=Marinobacter sp. CA1 TaxID=2817656 RepID=UPI001D08CBA2|nr:PilC/PilY family type IV pilus protein [Marinobacter sp. CA1]UDL04371.1 hypothetical protein J2887_17000 [Marinobacter sp. CA1]